MSAFRFVSRGVLILVLAGLPAVLGEGTAHAAPGDLDPTFGTGGQVVTPFDSTVGANAVAIQDDGKIVVAGDEDQGGASDFAVARYTSSGALDDTFGTGGIVTTDFADVCCSHDVANAVAIQDDGRIVVAGFGGITTNDDFQIARYEPSGALDASFGTGGKLKTAVGPGDDIATAVAIQDDDKIVVAGYAGNFGSQDFALVRYTSSGALDGSFGAGGKVTTSFSSFGDFANAMVIRPDGKIVLAGYDSSGNFALARYTTAGALDGLFGTSGKVTIDLGGFDQANAVALQADGKIVAAGTTFGASSTDFALARLTASGALDVLFGTGGKVVTDFGSFNDGANAVAVQEDGTIVAAGSAIVNTGDSDFGLAWYTPAGALDASFGQDGKVTTDFGSPSDGAAAVAVQADGRIVATGFRYNGSSFDLALARYRLDPTQLSIGDSSIIEGDAGTSDMSFTVSLGSGSSELVTVQYATVADTATSADYVPTGGTLRFLPGQTTKTVVVPVKGDLVDEPDETFYVQLSNPSGAPISDAFGEGTITDDDPLPIINISNPTVAEGNSGSTAATFTLTLSNPSGQYVTVDYDTDNGTATAGSDYRAKSGTKVFFPGQTTKTVTVAVFGETAQEPNETFRLTLSDPDNALLGPPGYGEATITDDDRPTISINDRSVTETNGTTTVNMVFTVTLNKAGTSTVTVQYATANNTAVAPGDYTAKSGTLTFTAGQVSKTISIVIKGDSIDEPNETFFVNLSNATNASIADGQGVGTINDND